MKKILIFLFTYSVFSNLDINYLKSEYNKKQAINVCSIIVSKKINEKDTNQLEALVSGDKFNNLRIHILESGHLGYYKFVPYIMDCNSLPYKVLQKDMPRGIFYIDDKIEKRMKESHSEEHYLAPNIISSGLTYFFMDPDVPATELSLEDFVNKKLLVTIFAYGKVTRITEDSNTNIQSRQYRICIDISVPKDIVPKICNRKYIGVVLNSGTTTPTNMVRLILQINSNKFVFPITLYPI